MPDGSGANYGEFGMPPYGWWVSRPAKPENIASFGIFGNKEYLHTDGTWHGEAGDAGRFPSEAEALAIYLQSRDK